MNKVLFAICLIGLTALGCSTNKIQPAGRDTPLPAATTSETNSEPQTRSIYFGNLDATYKFSADVPVSWQVEYVAANDSINIYDPVITADSNLEKSVIFMRNFSANSFLTLQTVNILNRKEVEVRGHKAVRYEITKKPGVANFANQPLWRSRQHQLIDVRYANTNPSDFFVIAYNPTLADERFDEFIASIKFDND